MAVGQSINVDEGSGRDIRGEVDALSNCSNGSMPADAFCFTNSHEKKAAVAVPWVKQRLVVMN